VRRVKRKLDRMVTGNYNVVTLGLSFEWDERKELQKEAGPL
jgi:hypothetical protein